MHLDEYRANTHRQKATTEHSSLCSARHMTYGHMLTNMLLIHIKLVSNRDKSLLLWSLHFIIFPFKKKKHLATLTVKHRAILNEAFAYSLFFNLMEFKAVKSYYLSNFPFSPDCTVQLGSVTY